MTTWQWISLAALVLFTVVPNIVAFVVFFMREAVRRERIEDRLKILEEKAEDAEKMSEQIAKLNAKISTLITILREQKLVNGHPDLEG